MNELSALPFRGNPHDDEGFMGFALRMSNLNGFRGVYWLYKLLGRDRLNHFTEEDLPDIAGIFGADFKSLAKSYVRSRREHGEVSYIAHEHAITRPYLLRPLRPQLCPRCVADCGYMRSLWDYSLVSACTRHRCGLIDECPQCGKRIQWMRPDLKGCRCNFFWSQVESEPLSPADPTLQLAEIIETQMATWGGHVPKAVGSLNKHLCHLSLDTLFRLVWIFGIKDSAADSVTTGISRTILRCAEARSITCRAYSRLLSCLTDVADFEALTQEIHMPSLYRLSYGLTDTADLQFVGSLLQQIGVAPRSKQLRAGRQHGQLTLF